MTPLWAFYIGLLLGMIAGIFVTAVFTTAKQSDERAKRFNARDEDRHFDDWG